MQKYAETFIQGKFPTPQNLFAIGLIRPIPYEQLSFYTLPPAFLKLANVISLNGFENSQDNEYQDYRDGNHTFIQELIAIQQFLHFNPLNKTASLHKKWCQNWTVQHKGIPRQYFTENKRFLCNC